MKIFKAILLTVAWIIITQLIALWLLLIPDETTHFENIIKASDLITRVVVLVLLIGLLLVFKQYDSLKFNRASSIYYLAAIILGIGFVFFQPILAIIYHLDFSTDYFRREFSMELLSTYPLVVISSVILAPITEELFFRGFILRGLLENYGAVIAILVSSLLFSSIHIPMDKMIFGYDWSFWQVFMTVFGGAVAGFLFYKSKSIIPPILYHMFWNLTAAVT